jgi:hypothetical protein
VNLREERQTTVHNGAKGLGENQRRRRKPEDRAAEVRDKELFP